MRQTAMVLMALLASVSAAVACGVGPEVDDRQQQIEKLVTTPHFRSFETMHRSPEAKLIGKQLGIRSVKRTDRCVTCHYTPEVTSRGVKAQSGISCESCHGPSQFWVKGHNDYGGPTLKKETESLLKECEEIRRAVFKLGSLLREKATKQELQDFESKAQEWLVHEFITKKELDTTFDRYAKR